MTEDRPPAPDRKTSFVAPLVIGGAVLVLLAALLLSRPHDEPAPAPVPAPPPAVAAPPPEPAKGPLDRRAMIEAAAAEAAAYAAGADSPKSGAALKGRVFVLRLPFGCEGVQGSPGAAQALAERGEDGKTARLSARPTTWTTLPLMQASSAKAAPEAVEGFWMPRPWTYAETCPPQRDREAPATPTPAAIQTLGLAQLFEAGGSRVLRRDGRPYEFVRKAPPEGLPAGTSYSLLLEGRIAAFPDGRPIRCDSESPDHRPICFYAVTFERVAFQTAKGDILAEWRE